MGNRWVVLACVGAGSLVSGISSSVVVSVLPLIARDFRASMATISWVPMANLVVLSSLLLTFGRVADIVGHKRVFLLGLSLLLSASSLAAVSPNEYMLIVCSMVLACGTGMAVAAGLVLVTQSFGDSHRGRGIGLMTSITYLGLVAGPALGGLIAAAWSWRGVYFLNLPIAIVGLVTGWRVLPTNTATAAGSRFDVSGAGASALMLTSLLLAVSQGQTWGWASLPTFAALVVAAAAGVVFVRLERKNPAPMLDLHLLEDRLFTTAVASALFNYVAAFFQTFLLPFYLLQARGFSPRRAGVLIMVAGIAMLAVTPIAGSLSDRIGSRLLTVVGLLLSSLGLFALALLNETSGLLAIGVAQFVTGLGAGMFSSPNTSAIMGEVPAVRRGTAAGMQAMARNTGMVLGIALAGAILNLRLATLGAGQFVGAFHDTMLVGSAIALLGAVVSASRNALPRGIAATHRPRDHVSAWVAGHLPARP